MYILKNSIISIVRNKGRNILIGIIILVIACSSTVTLAIRNTANRLVKNYEESHDIIAKISFNRKGLAQNFKGGADARKENIEAFNNIESITIDDIKNYGDSENLKGFYYMYSTSLNSDSLTKATDSFEYEVENRQTTTNSSSTTTGENNGTERFAGEGFRPERRTTINNNTTTVITKSKEIFQSSRNLTGDFTINGYSSYDAMTDFVNGTHKITEGEMITGFNVYECVISSELATLNQISVGDNIEFKNSNLSKKTYQFKVTGIYTDNSNTDDTQNMYSNSVNSIITGSGVIELLVQDDSTLVTNITPSFIIKTKDNVEKFTEEVKQKGLNEYYAINTNIEQLDTATKSIKNVETFATTFLIITLIISAIVVVVINMINIRERKYEIGVFRTIGISKFKLTIQFIIELFIVSIIMLSIGTVCGSFLAKPVGNELLKTEIENVKVEEQEISTNFGKGPMNMNFNTNVQVEQINSINAVVDFYVVLELIGIGVFLVLLSSIASMISIQRFSPLTILKERS
ncbi:MAG TPA: ABC transporter permease [Clostridia bacterium]|nr:ABC transporter permease [Clostridia bacterium]